MPSKEGAPFSRLQWLSVWRDGQLVKRHGDEAAAYRVRQIGLEAALGVTPPTEDELGWTDLNGEPIDPAHQWWGYSGQMSEIEKTARRLGKWPPG